MSLLMESILGARQLTPDEVSLSNCITGVCKLKRRTDAVITLKVTPDRESKKKFRKIYDFIFNGIF